MGFLQRKLMTKKSQNHVARSLGLNWLLILIPIVFLLEKSNADPVLTFLGSAFAIIPLSKLIGESTEALSHYLGSTVGGLMNATLGNAPEIIIGYFALQEGLVDMVKASITGSIIANLLIGLGLTFIACGARGFNKFVRFNFQSYQVHSGVLTLAVCGLVIPAVFNFTTDSERQISIEISVVLFVIYVLSVVSTFLPKAPDSDSDDVLEIVRVDDPAHQETPKWSQNKALFVLTIVTIALAFMSESMTNSIAPATSAFGLTQLFVGVFILALLGNVSELINGVRFARNGQVELAIGIFLGGGSQMALLVAPSLVFLGIYHGQKMDLLFSKYELIALIMTVISVSKFMGSGRVKPEIGLGLVSLYIILGIGFYYAR
jgi:Ca2+:H+ antiporter